MHGILTDKGWIRVSHMEARPDVAHDAAHGHQSGEHNSPYAARCILD